MDPTPASLLQRLRNPDDVAAWGRFVELYTPLLFVWARRLGASEADAEDLIQDLFILLLRKFSSFVYNPDQRFRGWLWTVLRNLWTTRCRSVKASDSGMMSPEPAIADPAQELAEREYRAHLVARAVRLMRTDFQPLIWQAFWQTAVAGRSADEVAPELGLSVNAIYCARSRVLRRLRQELEGLLD